MAISSFTTVFKIPKKALREIAKNIDKPVFRFKLSEKDKEKAEINDPNKKIRRTGSQDCSCC